jgi:hypothetical protein
MRLSTMNRWQAFACHLTFSLILGAAVYFLFREIWYPDALFALADAGGLLALVVAVDTTLGPLLTLIAFDPKKKSHLILLDLSIILILQIGALAYGVRVMAQSRPVFLVAMPNRFDLICANDLDPEQLAKASQDQWRTLSWTGPVVVGARLPADPDARADALFAAFSAGVDLSARPEYYVAVEDMRNELVRTGRALSDYAQSHGEAVTMVRARLAGEGLAERQIVLVPLKTRKKFGGAVVETATGRLLFTTTIPV